MPRTVACFHNFGGLTGRETPLPIPNRAVKPASADGTRRATSRESRSPPNYLRTGRESGPFCCLEHVEPDGLRDIGPAFCRSGSCGVRRGGLGRAQLFAPVGIELS